MQYSLFAQLMARDPRKVVRFPEVPIDDALLALQELESALEKLKSLPPQPAAASTPPIGSMPPVVPAEPAATAETVEEKKIDATKVVLDEFGGPIAGLATQVWRARNRVIDPATGEPREEMRRVHRHVEGAYEVFAQMGVVIKDWLNQPYDAGLPVKVLTFQPEPELQRDTVLETVRPTVIWKDQLLQLGEVIVGIPKSLEENPK
jgi:hypothetical protein